MSWVLYGLAGLGALVSLIFLAALLLSWSNGRRPW